MTHGFNLTELLKTNEALVKELADVKVQLRLCVEALKLYRGISGLDCEKSTTKWSSADAVLMKIDKRFR